MNGVQVKLNAPLRPAARSQTADNLHAFSHCDPADVPAHGLSCNLHVAARRLKGYYSSGWHLHQSLVDAKSGRNLFAQISGAALSPLGMNYLGGLLHHAMASTVLANPTINGYRRFRMNSLAPDRVAWGTDHRGVMLRDPGGSGRYGEPD